MCTKFYWQKRALICIYLQRLVPEAICCCLQTCNSCNGWHSPYSFIVVHRLACNAHTYLPIIMYWLGQYYQKITWHCTTRHGTRLVCSFSPVPFTVFELQGNNNNNKKKNNCKNVISHAKYCHILGKHVSKAETLHNDRIPQPGVQHRVNLKYCLRQYIMMGNYLCSLLASDKTYDYETWS